MRSRALGMKQSGATQEQSRYGLIARRRMFRASSLAIALAACGFLSATPSQAGIVAIPGTTYTGVAPPAPGTEYDFSGLTPGSLYDLFVMSTDSGDLGALEALLYHDSVSPGNLIGQTVLNSPQSHDFTGLLPSAELILVLETTNPACASSSCEGYSLKLTADTRTAPEPATIALLGAGLLGALVTRRRKRR
jgi:PEP-CTERM motif-containing protein